MGLCSGHANKHSMKLGTSEGPSTVGTRHGWGRGSGLSREVMSKSGLGYPGQDLGFGGGHKEICDSGFVGLQQRTLSPLPDGVNYSEVSVISWTGLTPSGDPLRVLKANAGSAGL